MAVAIAGPSFFFPVELRMQLADRILLSFFLRAVAERAVHEFEQEQGTIAKFHMISSLSRSYMHPKESRIIHPAAVAFVSG